MSISKALIVILLAATPYGKYWTLVAISLTILALDERGDLLLINANREKFELFGRCHVSDSPSWAQLAVCDDEVFVRDFKGLTVHRWIEESGTSKRPQSR